MRAFWMRTRKWLGPLLALLIVAALVFAGLSIKNAMTDRSLLVSADGGAARVEARWYNAPPLTDQKWRSDEEYYGLSPEDELPRLSVPAGESFRLYLESELLESAGSHGVSYSIIYDGGRGANQRWSLWDETESGYRITHESGDGGSAVCILRHKDGAWALTLDFTEPPEGWEAPSLASPSDIAG